MACLAVYEEVAKHLDKESLAQEVLPELWKMALDTQLSLNQFKKFMKNINDLTRRVEELHSKHLETLNNIEGKIHNSSLGKKRMYLPHPSPSYVGIQKIGDTMQDFEKLVNHSTGVGRQPIAPPVKTADFMSDFDPPTLSPRASVTTGATFTATTVSSNYTRPISYTPPSNSSAFNASTSNGHRASSFGQVSPHNNNNNTAANQNFNLYFGSSPAFPTTATSASTSNFAAFNSTVAQPQTLSSMGSFGSGTQPQSNVRKPNSNMAKEFDPFN